MNHYYCFHLHKTLRLKKFESPLSVNEYLTRLSRPAQKIFISDFSRSENNHVQVKIELMMNIYFRLQLEAL